MSKTVDTVTKIIKPLADEASLELVDVEFVKEPGGWYLRIYIDKEGGITIDDCESFSRRIDQFLDKETSIEGSYDFLEVSSPGIERPLKKEADFVKCKGKVVEVKLYKPFDGQKVFEGELEGLIDNKVVIKAGAGTIEFPKEDVSLVKLTFKM